MNRGTVTRQLRRGFAIAVAGLSLTAACGDDASDPASAPGSVTPPASEESDTTSAPTTQPPPETTAAVTQPPDAESTSTESTAPSATTEPDESDEVASASAGCVAGEVVSGGEATSREILVEGIDRSYLLYVPTAYGAGQGPSPLVVNLHGGTADAAGQQWFTEFDEIAESEGVVVAYGEAPGGFWNLAGDVERNYVNAVIDDVEATLCIDSERVYLMGFSQGGDLTTLLSCSMTDRIAAFASVGVLNHHATACPDTSAVRVVAIVGATDPVTSEGLSGVPDPDPPQPLTDEIASWVETNDCDPAPAESMPSPDVSRREFSCAEGGTLVVYLHPDGHIWPRSPFDAIDANTVAWDFMSNNPAPQS